MTDYKYDVFISYSRKDVEFARKLQRALGAYAPPREVPVPQRRLRVFRDEADFQGTEYHDALEQNLKSAAKLLVIASPNSRASDYVGGELRAFAALRGKEHIISLLLDGVPNNEPAVSGAQKAFHEELVARLPIPLAADSGVADRGTGWIAIGLKAPGTKRWLTSMRITTSTETL